jgi:hypothetical protein
MEPEIERYSTVLFVPQTYFHNSKLFRIFTIQLNYNMGPYYLELTLFESCLTLVPHTAQ